MNWKVLGDSVVGVSHGRTDTPCQDAYAHRIRADGQLIVVVADGAGSASHSVVGARVVCDTLADAAEACSNVSNATRDWLVANVQNARGRLVVEAERLDLRPRDFACTLLFALVGPAGAMLAQVGDGGIVFDVGDGYGLAFWPQRGEYVNETHFITDDGWQDHLQFRHEDRPLSELAVLTDGLQAVSLDARTKTPHEPFFGALFRRLRAAVVDDATRAEFHALLAWEKLNDHTNDDKTLVLASRCA